MTGSGPLALTSRSEDRLLKQIQVLLEKAYKLQDEGETLFLHQVTLMTCKMFYSFFPLAFEHFGSGFVIYLSFVSHTYDSPSPKLITNWQLKNTIQICVWKERRKKKSNSSNIRLEWSSKSQFVQPVDNDRTLSPCGDQNSLLFSREESIATPRLERGMTRTLSQSSDGGDSFHSAQSEVRTAVFRQFFALSADMLLNPVIREICCTKNRWYTNVGRTWGWKRAPILFQ